MTKSNLGTAASGLAILVISFLAGNLAESRQNSALESLERERVSPEPIPGLKVPDIPGTQAVVIRQYGSAKKPEQEAAPIALHMPNKFFPRSTDRIVEVWGINTQPSPHFEA
jgi:hypothetical protein